MIVGIGARYALVWDSRLVCYRLPPISFKRIKDPTGLRAFCCECLTATPNNRMGWVGIPRTGCLPGRVTVLTTGGKPVAVLFCKIVVMTSGFKRVRASLQLIQVFHNVLKGMTDIFRCKWETEIINGRGDLLKKSMTTYQITQRFQGSKLQMGESLTTATDNCTKGKRLFSLS